MGGFPDEILESAFGPGALPRLRGTVAHLRREAVHRDPTGGAEADATATVLDLQAAEIEARIDGAGGES